MVSSEREITLKNVISTHQFLTITTEGQTFNIGTTPQIEKTDAEPPVNLNAYAPQIRSAHRDNDEIIQQEQSFLRAQIIGFRIMESVGASAVIAGISWMEVNEKSYVAEGVLGVLGVVSVIAAERGISNFKKNIGSRITRLREKRVGLVSLLKEAELGKDSLDNRASRLIQ